MEKNKYVLARVFIKAMCIYVSIMLHQAIVKCLCLLSLIELSFSQGLSCAAGTGPPLGSYWEVGQDIGASLVFNSLEYDTNLLCDPGFYVCGVDIVSLKDPFYMNVPGRFSQYTVLDVIIRCCNSLGEVNGPKSLKFTENYLKAYFETLIGTYVETETIATGKFKKCGFISKNNAETVGLRTADTKMVLVTTADKWLYYGTLEYVAPMINSPSDTKVITGFYMKYMIYTNAANRRFPYISQLAPYFGTPCVTCEPNYYCSGNQYQQSCPPDSSYSNAGASSCICRPGFYMYQGACYSCPTSATSSAGSTSCYCVADYYQLNGFCNPCPVNSKSPERSTSISACQCKAGYYKVGTACPGCPVYSVSSDGATVCTCNAGYYYDQTNSVCSGCPQFSNSPAGSTASSACTCNSGYYSVSSTAIRRRLLAGFYVTPSGTMFCCPVNSILNGGKCDCNAGFYAINSGCSACPSSSTSPQGSLTWDSCRCNAGYYMSGSSCIGCRRFASAPAGATLVSQCTCNAGYTLRGEYCCPTNSFLSGTECMCNAAYYKSNFDCVACPANAYSNVNSLSFSDCKCLGTYYMSNSACASCPDYAGSAYGSMSISACTCIANYYMVDLRCYRCPTGATSPAASTSIAACQCSGGNYMSGSTCLTCPAPSTSVTGSTSILQCRCAANYYMSNSACNLCPTSSISSEGSTAFAACQCNAGFYMSGSSCSACQQFSTSSAGSTSASACTCNTGFYLQGSYCCPTNSVLQQTTCACNQGYYRDGSSCTGCPSYSNSAIGSTSRSACTCNSGYYWANTYCCPANSDTSCSCNVGYYFSSAQCVACQQNATSPKGSTSRSQCQCNSGYYLTDVYCCPTQSVLNSAKVCSCNSGYYRTGHSCTKCPLYSTSPVSSTSLSNCTCNSGFYMNYLKGFSGDESRCLCNPGTYRSNQDECTACPVGMECPGLDWLQYCTMGTFASSLGRSTCLNCSAGSFVTADGSSSCIQCSSGKYSVERATLCTECNKGQYAPFTGASVCQPCPSGQFTPSNGTTACTRCPFDSTSPVSSTSLSNCTCNSGFYMNYLKGFSGDESRCLCNPGTYRSNLYECTDCPVGMQCPGLDWLRYCPIRTFAPSTRSSACLVCSAGSFNSAPSSCIPCQAGTYSPDSAVACAPCSNGSFSDTAGMSSCLLCSVGLYSWSSTGVSICSSCPAGTFSGAGYSACAVCPVGQYSNQSRQTVCLLCLAGSYVNAPRSSSCMQCSRGKYSLEGAPSCIECSSGKYSLDGATFCSDCDRGQYAPVAGATVCQPCPSGQFTQSNGSAVCNQCAPGKTSTIGVSVCTTCPIGQASTSPGLPSCTACSPGSFSDANGLSVCSLCEKGSASSQMGGSTCQSCWRGTYADQSGLSSCYMCEAGYFSDSSGSMLCSTCSAGTMSNVSGSSSCFICNAGSFADSIRASVCTFCPGGAISTMSGATGCTNCQVGTFTNSSPASQCTNCPAGRIAAVSQSQTCEICSPGSYAQTGASSCELCRKGTYQSLAGASSSSACTACMAGTFQSILGASRFSQCQMCMAGTYQSLIGQSAVQDCAMCDAGKYQSLLGVISASNCTACAAGTFQPKKGQGAPSACIPCSPGAYQTSVGVSSSSACALCPSGMYSTMSGATASASCVQCPAGTFQSSTGVGNSAVCTVCAAGSYQTRAGWSSACLLCDRGKYQTGDGMTSSDRCQLCAAGTYLSVSGATASITCTLCGVGTYQTGLGATHMSNCSMCGSGTYQSGTGIPASNACTVCAAGSYQSGSGMYGSNQCQLCNAGSYQSGYAGSTCLVCAKGTFQESTSASACRNCQGGQFAYATGQTACQTCSAGTANEQLGQSTCIACAVGKFTMLDGMQACFACQEGQITSTTGQSQCSLCNEGTVAGTAGMSQCEPCKAGQFQNKQGQGSCLDCNGGTYQPELGKSTCTLCSPGTVQSQSGASACTTCNTGQFQASTGMQLCNTCQGGQYQSMPGATVCETCQSGYVQSTTGSSACSACAAGAWQPNRGALLCAVCSPGQYQTYSGASTCVRCSAGLYNSMIRANNSAACVPCRTGTFGVQAGLSVCEFCAAGKYTSVSGAVMCAQCSQGLYLTGSGSSACSLCATGKYGTGVGGQSERVCEACAVGTFTSVIGSPSCASCDPGTFSEYTGLSACVNCAAGYAQPNAGTSTCVPCKAGTYISYTGVTLCRACSAGTYQSVPGASQCRACSPGTFGPQTGISTDGCSPCVQGTYSSAAGMSGQSTCQKCQSGMYSSATGAVSNTSCSPCAAGTYSEGNASGCIACPSGTVCIAGMSSPTVCETGLICDGLRIDAPPGYLPYLSKSGLCTALLTCPFGTRCAMKSPQLGKGILQQRPSNGTAFVMYMGGTQSTPSCQQSLFYDSTRVDFGLTALLFWDVLYWLEPAECGMGSYLLDSQCIKCPPGTFSANPFALSNATCVRCSPGTVAWNEGAQSCAPCQFGRYAAVTGGSVCSLCATGTFQDQVGTSRCQSCAPGTFASGAGLFTCTSCSAGDFQAETGTSVCRACGESQFSSTGDPVCSECNQRLTPAPGGVTCAVKTVPDDVSGTGSLWISVQGFTSDECLGVGLTTVVQGQASLQVLVNRSTAQCLHSLFAMGMRTPLRQWLSTVNKLRMPAVLRVYAFNRTTSPGVCRRHDFGVVFTVRDSAGSMFTDVSGAYAEIVVKDKAVQQILYMQACERLPASDDLVPYGTCTIPGAMFCPVADVTVQVTFRAPGMYLLSGSVDIQAGGVSRPCTPSASNLILIQLLDADGPFLPSDVVRVQLVLAGSMAQYGAFRLVLSLSSTVTFLSFQSTLTFIQQNQNGTLTISAALPAGSSNSILGELQLQFRSGTAGVSTVLCPLVAASTLTLTSGWSVDAMPLSIGFTCVADGCLNALTDSGETTALIATPSRGMLIQWKMLASNARIFPGAVHVVGIGKVPGSVVPVVSATCRSLSTHLLVASCTNVTAQGKGIGNENAEVGVSFLGVSTSVFFAVFIPQNLVVWSSVGKTGIGGRYKLFTTLQAGGTSIANVDATPYAGNDFLRLYSNVLGDDTLLTDTPWSTMRAVGNEQWTCTPGQTGVLQLFGQPLGTCQPAIVFETLDLFVFTGGQAYLGNIIMNPSYLATGQTSGIILPFSGTILVSADSASSRSPTSLSMNGVTANLQLTGSPGLCTPVQFTVRNRTFQASIPVYPPGPSWLDVRLGTTLLVSINDMTNFMPYNTTVTSVVLVFADDSTLDVTADPRLVLQGFGVRVYGRTVEALAAPGAWAVQAQLQGIPCVTRNTSVQVAPFAVQSSVLVCQGCYPLTCPDDPLSQQYPAWFPSIVDASRFTVVHTLVDGSLVQVTEPLVVTGSARLNGAYIQAVSAGQALVRTASTTGIQLTVYRRWAVTANLRCNHGSCTNLLLAPVDDTATLSPFFYKSSLVATLELGLKNGTLMNAGLMDGVSLTYNGIRLDTDSVPLKYGPLVLRYSFSSDWELPSGSVQLNVARFQAVSILGPNQIFQMHCSQIWQEVRFSTQVVLSDGNIRNITTNMSCTLPLVMHGKGLFHADWAGAGLILAAFGKETASKSVTALTNNVFFTQIKLDAIPDVWEGVIGATVSLSTILFPVFATSPWYNISNLTQGVVEWSTYPDDIITFVDDAAILSRDCYVPLTVYASLKACDSFPRTRFSKTVTINVQPSVAGQMDIGNSGGAALEAVPVGGEMTLDLAIYAPSRLQSYLIECSIPKSVLLGTGCVFCVLLQCECNSITTPTATIFRASGAMLQSDAIGRVVIASLTGIVRLNALVQIEITLIQASIGTTSIRNQRSTATIQFGTVSGLQPSGRRLLASYHVAPGRRLLAQSSSFVWGDTDGNGIFDSLDVLFLQAFLLVQFDPDDPSICAIVCQKRSSLSAWQVSQLNPLKNPSSQPGTSSDSDAKFLLKVLAGKSFFLATLKITSASGSFKILFDLIDYQGRMNPDYAQAQVILNTTKNKGLSFDSLFMSNELGLTVMASRRTSSIGIATLSSAAVFDETNIETSIVVQGLNSAGAISEDRTVVFLPTRPVATFNAISSDSVLLPSINARYIPVLNCRFLCESASAMFLDFTTQPAEWLDPYTINVKFAISTPQLQGFPFQPPTPEYSLPSGVRSVLFMLGLRQKFVGAPFNVTFRPRTDRTIGLYKIVGAPLLNAAGAEWDQNVFLVQENRAVQLTIALTQEGTNIIQIWVVQQLVRKTTVQPPSRPIVTALFTGISRRLIQVYSQALCPWAIQWSVVGGVDDPCAVRITPIWSDGPSAENVLYCTRYPCQLGYKEFQIVPNVTVLRPTELQLTVQKTLVSIMERAHWRASCVLQPLGIRVSVNFRALQAGVMSVTPPNALMLNNNSFKGSRAGMSILSFGSSASVVINVSSDLDPPTRLDVFTFLQVVYSIGDGEMNATFVSRDLNPGDRVFVLSQAFFSNWFVLSLDAGVDANYSIQTGPNVSTAGDGSLVLSEHFLSGNVRLALVTYQGLTSEISKDVLPITPIALLACCNDSYVTYPGSAAVGLGGLGTSFAVLNISAMLSNGMQVSLTMDDPRMSETHDPLVFKYSSNKWTVWSYIQSRIGETLILLTYTQPGSLAQIHTTIRVYVIDIKAFVVNADYPLGGDANGLYRIHCSNKFQEIVWSGLLNLGRFWVDVSDELTFSVSNKTVLSMVGRRAVGVNAGSSTVVFFSHGFMQTRRVTVLDSSTRITAISTLDFDLYGPQGSTAPINVTGHLESGESIHSLERDLNVQCTPPMEVLYSIRQLVLLRNSVGGLNSTIYFGLDQCNGVSPSTTSLIRVRIQSDLARADVEYIPSSEPTQMSFQLAGDSLLSFYTEISSDSLMLGCSVPPVTGLIACKIDPVSNRALFSGVVFKPYKPPFVFGTVETAVAPQWIAGLLETTDTGLVTKQTRVMAGRMGDAPDIPFFKPRPVVDTGTLARQFTGLVDSGSPSLREVQMNLELLVRQTFLVDVRLYSNEFELSGLFRMTDRFLDPLNESHAHLTVLFRTNLLPVLDGTNLTKEGLLAELTPTEGGWFVIEWLQQIPRLNLSVSYTLCAKNCSRWQDVTTWEVEGGFMTGQPLAQCPRGAYAQGTILAQYTVIGNGTLLLSDQGLQKMACNVRVPTRRIMVSQDTTGRLSLAVAVESFNRLSEINFAVMSQPFMDVFFPLLNFSVSKLERNGIRFINDSADIRTGCPPGMYLDADGSKQPLPMHASVGADCFQFECIDGYQAEDRVCVPVSFSGNLLWTIVVIVLSLAVTVSSILCVLQLLCMKRTEEDVRIDMGDEDGTLPTETPQHDEDELSEIDLDALGLVRMDPMSRSLLPDQYSPPISPHRA